MRGVAGVVALDGRPLDLSAFELLQGSVDHQLNQVEVGAHYGVCAANQSSLVKNEHLILVFDGWLSNAAELQASLGLPHANDAELLLAGYHRWQGNIVDQLQGDFAFVLVDERNPELFLARDRRGHRCLHYHFDGNVFSFATDVRCLLVLPWVPERPNRDRLAEYLTVSFQSRDATLWEEIKRAIPAERITVIPSDLKRQVYWDPSTVNSLHYRREEEYAEHYLELLKDVVARHTQSNATIAIDVSGGLDSSAVLSVALAVCESDIAAWTASYRAGSDADELVYAKLVADAVQIPLNRHRVGGCPPDLYREQANYWRDFPGFSNMMQSIKYYEAIRETGAKVVLSGQGGDEWFQGSRYYYAEDLAALRIGCLIRSFRADLDDFGLSKASYWLMRHGFFTLLPLSMQNGLRHAAARIRGRAWPVPIADETWIDRELVNRLHRFDIDSDIRRSRIGGAVLLKGIQDAFSDEIMVHNDRLARMAGLEARHPLNDARIVEFAFAIPERLRLQGDRTKVIHRQAMQSVLPVAVAERWDKAEFSQLFLDDLGEMESSLLDEVIERRSDWINSNELRKVLDDTDARKRFCWELVALFGCDAVFQSEDLSNQDQGFSSRHS